MHINYRFSYLGRAPRTKETLPDFLKWHRVTRHPLVFRRLTGSQRTPRVWSVTFSFLRFHFDYEELSREPENLHSPIRSLILRVIPVWKYFNVLARLYAYILYVLCEIKK